MPSIIIIPEIMKPTIFMMPTQTIIRANTSNVERTLTFFFAKSSSETSFTGSSFSL